MGEILVGDVLDVVPALPERAFQAAVCSPPYYGLRSYNIPPSVWGGDAACAHEWGDETIVQRADNLNVGFNERWGNAPGQRKQEQSRIQAHNQGSACTRCNGWRGCLGNEPTPALFIAHIVQVFRLVRRVLRDDGVLLLNLGDSYANDPGNGRGGERKGLANGGGEPHRSGSNRRHVDGLKHKDLMGIPWACAFALRDDGWYLRSAMPWLKRTALPESVQDRPSTALEYVFLLAKGPRPYWDADAVRRAAVYGRTESATIWDRSREASPVDGRANRRGPHNIHPDRSAGRNLRNADSWFESLDALIADTRAQLAHLERVRERGGALVASGEDGDVLGLDITPQSYAGQHFATYPVKLASTLIAAATSEHGACAACGAPWKRQTIESFSPHWKGGHRGRAAYGDASGMADRSDSPRMQKRVETTGWAPTCAHADAGVRACRVLDPFLGSGTTAIAAERLGRDWTGIELSEDYAAQARARTAQRGLFTAAADASAAD